MIGCILCLSFSEPTNQVPSLPVEAVVNKVRLPIGARGVHQTFKCHTDEGSGPAQLLLLFPLSVSCSGVAVEMEDAG